MKNHDDEISTPNVQIPTKLLLDKSIGAEHKMFYGLVYYFCNTNGYIWHKNATLAKHMGTSERAIRRALSALSEANYLVVKHHVKPNNIYKQKHERVVWLYNEFHGAKARAKDAKKEKPLTLTVFKRLVKKHYPVQTPIFAFNNWDIQSEFQIGYSIPLVLNGQSYLALEGEQTALFADDATKCWNAMFELYNRDATLFPVLADAKQQKEQS